MGDITLTIDGVTMPLNLAIQKGKKLWSVGELSRDLQAQATELGYGSLPIDQELIFSQTDWQDGFGQSNFKDKTRYADGKNIDTTLEGMFLLGGLPVATGIVNTGNALGSVAGDYIVKLCEFGSALYCAAGEYVYKWTSGSPDGWSLVGTMAAHVTDLCVFNGYLYIGQGEDVKYYYTANGTTYTQSTRDDGYAKFFVVAPSDLATTEVLWKTWSVNSIWYTSDGRNGEAAWTFVAYLGNASSATSVINSLISFNNMILVGRWNGLYYVDSTRQVWNLMSQFQAEWSTHHFTEHTKFNNNLYVNIGRYRIMEITPSFTFQYIGPVENIEELQELPSGASGKIFGYCYGLTSGVGYLYALVYSYSLTPPSTYTYEYIIYKGKPVGQGANRKWQWSPYAEIPNNGATTNAIGPLAYFDNIGYAQRAIWCVTSDNKASHIIISDSPHRDWQCTFNTGDGYLITGWYDAGFPTWTKLLQAITMECRGSMDANVNVTPYYEIDESGSWVQIGSAAYIAAAAATKKYLTANISYKKIRFKIALNTNDSTKTPIVKLFATHGQVRPPFTKLYDFWVDVSRGEGLNKTIRSFLLGGRTSTSLITLVDRFDTSNYIVFLPGYPKEEEIINEARRESTPAIHVMAIGVDWG